MEGGLCGPCAPDRRAARLGQRLLRGSALCSQSQRGPTGPSMFQKAGRGGVVSRHHPTPASLHNAQGCRCPRGTGCVSERACSDLEISSRAWPGTNTLFNQSSSRPSQGPCGARHPGSPARLYWNAGHGPREVLRGPRHPFLHVRLGDPPLALRKASHMEPQPGWKGPGSWTLGDLTPAPILPQNGRAPEVALCVLWGTLPTPGIDSLS